MPIENNDYTVIENLIVLKPETATDDLLIYEAGDNNLLSERIKSDIIFPDANYHGGHNVIAIEPKFEDCGKLEYEIIPHEIISDNFNKGIIKNNLDNFWKEDYTTPIGLYYNIDSNDDFDNATEIYKFQKLASNQIIINILDTNIVPTVNDFLFMQRYFENEFTLENTQSYTINITDYTDGINNLPIYQSEYWVYKITARFQDPNDSNKWIITLDKDIKVINNKTYIFVLLNRMESSGKIKELFLDTWQKIEVKTKQLLGDNYNYIGDLKPQGKTNYLSYDGSEYLGIKNLLNSLNNGVEGINDDFIILDFENNIQDHLYYEDNSININLPGLLINDLKNEVLNIKNKNKILDSNVGNYGHLYYNIYSINENYETVITEKYIGYVFYDLRIFIITDLELIAALSYNSNRNFTLPEPITKNINEVQEVVINDFNENYIKPYTHFYTYRLKGINDTEFYKTLPYNKLKSFNWVNTQLGNTNDNNFTLEFDINTFNCLVDNVNKVGYEKEEIEIIIGEYDYDTTNPFNYILKGYKNVVVMNNLDWQNYDEHFKLKDNLGIKKDFYNIKFFKSQYINVINTNEYDLSQFWSNTITEDLFVGKCNWLIGNINFKTYIQQYKMQIQYKLLANKWNGTTNTTFNCDNNFQGGKLISEMALKFKDDAFPQIYAKISPPIIKTQNNDLLVRFNLDF